MFWDITRKLLSKAVEVYLEYENEPKSKRYLILSRTTYTIQH